MAHGARRRRNRVVRDPGRGQSGDPRRRRSRGDGAAFAAWTETARLESHDGLEVPLTRTGEGGTRIGLARVSAYDAFAKGLAAQAKRAFDEAMDGAEQGVLPERAQAALWVLRNAPSSDREVIEACESKVAEITGQGERVARLRARRGGRSNVKVDALKVGQRVVLNQHHPWFGKHPVRVASEARQDDVSEGETYVMVECPGLGRAPMFEGEFRLPLYSHEQKE